MLLRHREIHFKLLGLHRNLCSARRIRSPEVGSPKNGANAEGDSFALTPLSGNE